MKNINSLFLIPAAILGILFISLVIGTSNYIIPIGILVGLLCLIATFFYPPLPIFVILLINSKVLPFPQGGYLLSIFTVTCLLLSIFVSFFKKHSTLRLSWLPFIPIIMLLILWVYGSALGISNGNDVGFLKNESLIALNWLIGPVLLFSCTYTKDIKQFLINFLVATAIFVSLAGIFQYFTGISLGGAKVDVLETLGKLNSSVNRSTIPGKCFILFSIFYLVCKITHERFLNTKTNLTLLLLAIFSASILLSFGRLLWACSIFGLLLSTLLYSKKAFLLTVAAGTIISVTFYYAIYFINPDLSIAVNDRFLSIFKEGASNSSYGWRVTENYFANISIQKNLLSGIGLGGEYKPSLIAAYLFPNQTSYIHNSYYFFMLKFGIFSLIVFVSFITLLLVIIFKYLKKVININDKAFMASFVSSFVVILILSITQAEWINAATVSFMSILLAILSVVMKNYDR